MRSKCPHCGAQNEFIQPPSSAIVYCQSCGQPFGASSRNQTDPGALGFPDQVITNRNSAVLPPAPVIVPETQNPPNSTDPVARVVYVNPEGMEAKFVLSGSTTLGRHPSNKIRLNDREISKQHALIERRFGDWLVRDLDSSNGTFLNNRRIQEAPLRHGDELSLGSMRLSFVVERPEQTKESPRDLVTILPQDPGRSTHIHAKIEGDDLDFRPASEVVDVEILRGDYEKLRLTHELSRIGLTTDIKSLLSKTLDVVFGMLPADNGVIMLVDEDTRTLVPHTVRQRPGQSGPKHGILLSSTIVNASLQERASVLSSDAFLDPRFSGAESIIAQGIRAAMCVPLVAHDKVLGIMHLDSRERVGAFTEKDLQLLQAIATQTAIAIQNVRLLRQVEQEAQTRGQLSRFLPPHVVEEMVQGKGRPITKRGREVDASVVFCDIRGFTRMSESVGPHEIVELLNEYFERLVEIVFRYEGVLDKFIGDALMASWGTLEGEDVGVSAFHAVAAAIEFRDAIQQLNSERQERGQAPIPMGVGVNTGRLVAGYMGAKRRLEFTVIGDTVNTASRICGIADGGQVLLSEATYNLVAERVEAEFLGARRVKGREKDVGVYEATRVHSL
ncbi:MAG: FHA domain-containing protein [Myxococcales bacterium]|nr:FHA domain-containing protein [Myxococcales bacterium]